MVGCLSTGRMLQRSVRLTRGALAALVAVTAAAGLVLVGAGAARASGPVTVTFGVTGTHSWTVPPGVTSVTLSLAGGQGGAASRNPALPTTPGGRGAEVGASLGVMPGDVLAIVVAGAGGNNTSVGTGGGAGGFGGGGSGQADAAGGGGASTVTIGATLVAVAGGGGGAANYQGEGGDSGAPGTNGGAPVTAGGGGGAGTTSAGGTGGAGGDGSAWGNCPSHQSGRPGADGASGQGGDGGSGRYYGGGGGGGGYFGGGGGGGQSACLTRAISSTAGGGGGGSSYVDPAAGNTTVTEGARSGDGVVSITFVDSVGPTSSPALSPAANAAGWNDSPVTVDWNWTDAGAGVDPANCTQHGSSAGEGAQQVSATCTDLAGNTSSDSVSVKVDTSDPTVTISTPVDGASYQAHQHVTVDYDCADALSGIDTCTGTVANGSALDTSSVGAHTFTVIATDLAGNTTTTTVHYTVTPGAAATITATAGDGQAAKVGTTFTTALAATVADADANPVPAAVVTWTVTSGSATFPGGQATATATTDANGMATAADLTAGPTGGPVTVQASTPGVADPATYQLTVQQPPAITSDDTVAFTEGRPGTFTITTTGYPIPAITATSAVPDGLTLTDNGDGTATITGTPAAGTAGSYRITIDVENGVTDPTQTLTLTIRAADTTPRTPASGGLPFTGATPGPVLAFGTLLLLAGSLIRYGARRRTGRSDSASLGGER